jgi:hypothetical protein
VALPVATAFTAVAVALDTGDPAGAGLAIGVGVAVAVAVGVGVGVAGRAVAGGGVTAICLALAPPPGEANGWTARSSAAAEPARMADATTTVRRRDRRMAGGASVSFVIARGATLPRARESTFGAAFPTSPDFDRASACSTQLTSVAE